MLGQSGCMASAARVGGGARRGFVLAFTAAPDASGSKPIAMLLPAPPLPHYHSDLLLAQLWPALPTEEQASVLARLAAAEGREKLPAVQALAAKLAAKLRQLQ